MSAVFLHMTKRDYVFRQLVKIRAWIFWFFFSLIRVLLLSSCHKKHQIIKMLMFPLLWHNFSLYPHFEWKKLSFNDSLWAREQEPREKKNQKIRAKNAPSEIISTQFERAEKRHVKLALNGNWHLCFKSIETHNLFSQ